MSGVAGIVHFDGQPVTPGQIEAMTAAMAHRGPDGITHRQLGHAALGQCMLRTTPESLEEHLPLSNEDGSLWLVMDGRVDNFEDLRRELHGRGVRLRSRADAELVLRAYETWGEDCVHHVVGECVFFIWDTRRQALFAGRDAAGARHFYYHVGQGWLAFASEIKGLLALPQIERRLNDSRVLDYLVPEFDRDDEVSTFWQGIVRLPAGHALRATAAGVKAWRWWRPGELSEQRFASMAECTEAFMDQLRVAVRCRLRSIKPVGAMLSGGLDSSTIVGLISKEFRDQLSEPLRTVSLVREDRENCQDWKSIEAILAADGWLRPTILSSGCMDSAWSYWLQQISQADEPFALMPGLTYGVTYEAARQAGCGVVLDGMAGDVLFYSGERTGHELIRRRRWADVPAYLQAYRNHGWTNGPRTLVAAVRSQLTPQWLRRHARAYRDRQKLSIGDLASIQTSIASSYLRSRRTALYLAGDTGHCESDQHSHAGGYTSGMISFGHETYGPLALQRGVEPRSPFSDRRVIEFAIRMPIEAKLAIPRYKHLLRQGSVGMLPDATRWRRDVGNHPGWTFFDRWCQHLGQQHPDLWHLDAASTPLRRWLTQTALVAPPAPLDGVEQYQERSRRLTWAILHRWMETHATP